MSLLDTQKEIIKNYLNSMKLTDVCFGTITSANPVKVKIDNLVQELSGAFIVVPKELLKHDVELTINGVTSTYTMESQLKAGDKVIVLKKQGGQTYVVLGKVG